MFNPNKQLNPNQPTPSKNNLNYTKGVKYVFLSAHSNDRREICIKSIYGEDYRLSE